MRMAIRQAEPRWQHGAFSHSFVNKALGREMNCLVGTVVFYLCTIDNGKTNSERVKRRAQESRRAAER